MLNLYFKNKLIIIHELSFTMNKLAFRKILIDYLIFFSITIVSASTIVWIFQAVNFLDIMVEDGRGYLVYLYYSLLNIPKIISRLIPFVTFFSFFYILIKYENNNELIIFWNFGVNKIQMVYFFFSFSLILMFFQIILTTFIVPNTLKYSRNIMSNSDINLFEGFIKHNKFNDTVKNLTIYSESKNNNDELINIFIKKDLGQNSSQITYAKTGKLKIGDNNLIELYSGETVNIVNGQISKFKFKKSDFNLDNLETNTVKAIKFQETPTMKLISCLNKLYKKNYILPIMTSDVENLSHNCKSDSLKSIFREIYKRFILPLYIPSLILITLNLIIYSKEQKSYQKVKVNIFLISFLIIILSETSLKFIGDSLSINLFLIASPFMIIIFLLMYFKYEFNFKVNIKQNF
jgi:lipopolysaccharide export system permease protein